MWTSRRTAAEGRKKSGIDSANTRVLNIRMARSRSPAPNATRMALLGLLSRYGAKYGYELRTLIKDQNIDRIADVQYGSIYAVLKRLARDGLVAEGDRSRTGNRPERITFGITDSGEKELRRLLADALSDASQPERPIDIALHFSARMPTDEVGNLLRARLSALQEYDRQVVRLKAKTNHPHPGVQALIDDISEHFRIVNRAEQTWTKKVISRVEAGGYPTPGRVLEA